MLDNPTIQIIIASAVSAALAFFMYYKNQEKLKIKLLLGFLRFTSILVLLLLLVNPKIKKITYEPVKTSLPILLDNSKSVTHLEQNKILKETYSYLKNNRTLQEHFDVSFFRFGSEVRILDSLSFSDGQTQITNALETMEQIYKDTNAPILIFTDGNQTSGPDYTYYANQLNREVFPIVLGDTTNYPDVRIDKVTANRFSYLHNDFPVEIQTSLHGMKEASSEIQIHHKGQVIHREVINFKEGNYSLFTQIHLPANSLGLQTYELRLKPLDDEKNIANNAQNFAVDVLDSSGKIALVSDVIHPDLGVIKRSLEANSFFEVKPLTVNEAEGKMAGYNLIILYQSAQEVLLREIENQDVHVLYITGIHTNWDVLNQGQQAFSKKTSRHSDLVQGHLNPAFDLFLFENINFHQLPPLQTQFGMLEMKVPHTVVLEQYVSGQRSGFPLLALYEEGKAHRGILDAQDIWRWRSAVYAKNTSFEAFDDFMQGVVQYLAFTQQKTRLQVHYENFYYQNTQDKIRAQFFDSNYQLNRDASLEIKIFKEDSLVNKSPMLPTGLYQEIALAELKEASYTFEIIEPKSQEKTTGEFEILAYDIEEKFTRANIEDLQKLADITKAKVLSVKDLEEFIDDLITQDAYKIKEREIIKIESLVTLQFLLILLLISLALEWFLRKYFGLL